MKTVVLDLDGVMTNLHKGLSQRLGFNLEEHLAGVYDFWKVYPKHFKGFSWNDLGEDFWANLEPTAEASKINAMIESSGLSSFVFTCPINYYDNTLIKGCVEGKLRWIERYLPTYYKEQRYSFGRHKHFMANEEAILIDDNDKYVIDFKNAGGKAILYPRIWNSAWAFAKNIDNTFRSVSDLFNKYVEGTDGYLL